MTVQSRAFYEQIDRDHYAACKDGENHPAFKHLVKFIEDYKLQEKKCLEIGSATGIFQDLVPDYTGLDVAEGLQRYYHKPFFVVNRDGSYPFADASFDAVWTYAVHEHIPDLQHSLLELKRVLKPGGLVFFWPAWFCSRWAADGYAVRPYRDFSLGGKIVKALLPIFRSVWWRALAVFPKRTYRHVLFLLGKKYTVILYKKIKPNYEHYWQADSDACNSIDSHDAILWFESNQFKCISHPTNLTKFFVRHEPLILKKISPQI